MFDHIVRSRWPSRKKVGGAVGASAVLHLLIVLLLVFGLKDRGLLLADEMAGDGPDATEAGGGGGGGGGGGDGGEQVTYYELPATPAPQPQPPVPVPPEEEVLPPPVTPPVTPPPAETPPVPTPPAAVPAPRPTPPAAQPTAGTGGGTGAGTGAGQGPGQGPGVGPGSGGGTGGGTGGGIGSGTGPGTGGGEGSVIPPQADLQLFPPDPPRAVRGRSVQVTVAVNEQGNVTDAEVTISSGDRRYDQLLRRQAMEWHFRPARDRATGRPVAVKYPIDFDI